MFVAVADYESPELRVYEGQFLEVLDQSNPHMWLVKTKPTKVCFVEFYIVKFLAMLQHNKVAYVLTQI